MTVGEEVGEMGRQGEEDTRGPEGRKTEEEA